MPHWKIARTGTQVPKLVNVVQCSSVEKNRQRDAQFTVGFVLYDGTSNSEPTPHRIQIGILSGPM